MNNPGILQVGAKSFLRKPTDPAALEELVRLLHHYCTGWNLAADH